MTLLNFTDLHAQLVPLYFREPSANLGVGADKGLPPHLVGEKLLEAYKLGRGSVRGLCAGLHRLRGAGAQPTAGSAGSTAWRP